MFSWSTGVITVATATNKGTRNLQVEIHPQLREISGSRTGECVHGVCFLSHQADDTFWNIGKLLPDYMAQQPRLHPSSKL
jgi:hypothetical protein